MATITIKANSIHDNKNGTFSIEFTEHRPLGQAELKVIENLFPNLSEGVYKLLSQETLIACIATPSEILAEPKKPSEVTGMGKR